MKIVKIFIFSILLILLAPLDAVAQDRLPIFDAHLHYNIEARGGPWPLPRVLELFRQQGIVGIIANSRPNDGTRALAEAKAPGLRVVPFIRPYRTRDDIQTWFKDPTVRAHIQAEHARGGYRGIGEFHLYGADADSEGYRWFVEFAKQQGLWLLHHGDERALEATFRVDGQAKFIWAHTGFGTAPDQVEAFLKKHPTMVAELSYRSGIVDGSGTLTPEWRQLFTTYKDRFLLGSDTWVNGRWDQYGQTMDGYRVWLAQLPRDAAEAIAYRNGERIFGR
jgi:hypothetical protein